MLTELIGIGAKTAENCLEIRQPFCKKNIRKIRRLTRLNNDLISKFKRKWS